MLQNKPREVYFHKKTIVYDRNINSTELMRISTRCGDDLYVKQRYVKRRKVFGQELLDSYL